MRHGALDDGRGQFPLLLLAEPALGTGGTDAAQRTNSALAPAPLPLVGRLPPHAQAPRHFARPKAITKQLGRLQAAFLHLGMIASLQHARLDTLSGY